MNLIRTQILPILENFLLKSQDRIAFFLSGKDVNSLMYVEKTLYNRCKKILDDDENMRIHFFKAINLMFEKGYNPEWALKPYNDDWFKPENREPRHTDLLETINHIDTEPLFQDGVCINGVIAYRSGMGGRQATLLLQAVNEIHNPPKRLEVVSLLLKKGADSTLAVYWEPYGDPLSPIEAAKSEKDQQLIDLLTVS